MVNDFIVGGKQCTLNYSSSSKARKKDSYEYFTFRSALTQAQVRDKRCKYKRDGVLHDGTRSGIKRVLKNKIIN